MKILIMAGGTGERFWPLSTKEKPKQLLSLISDKTMIRETVERLIGFVEFEDIFIATNLLQYQNIMNELPEIDKDNFIIEPSFRDTAAAILYGSTYIANRFGENSVITVIASDHIIRNKDKFINSLIISNNIALKENKIVTLGIKPTYPETGYGYIKVKNPTDQVPNFQVKFFEKPSIDVAKKYIKSKKFLWNSGMFIFNYKTLIKNFNLYSKTHIEVLDLIKEKIDTFTLIELSDIIADLFIRFPKISIDYAVMEKSNDVVCLPVDIGWSDVGTFDSLFNQLHLTNLLPSGNSISLNSHSNLILNKSNARVSLIDIENLIVIITNNEILLLKKGSSSKIKNLLSIIREEPTK